MRLLPHFLSIALVVLLVDNTQARRHHHLADRSSPTTYDNTSLIERRQDASGVLRIGQSGFVNKATSYIIEDSANPSNTPDNNWLGGACGWRQMPRDKIVNGKRNGKIWGAAIQTKFFGEGKACGMCVLIKTTGQPQPPRSKPVEQPEFLKVSIVDECPNDDPRAPGTCVSLDLQVDGMLHLFGQPRVGQVDMIPTVVPCNFKANGIFVEVRQITPSPWDFRMEMRGNSGAVKLAYVSPPGAKKWVQINKSESNQYTMPNAQSAHNLLGSYPAFDLRLVSFENEEVILPNIKHNIGTQDFLRWQNTRENFVKS